MDKVLCTTLVEDRVSVYIKTAQGRYAVLSQEYEGADHEFQRFDTLDALKSAVGDDEYRNFLEGCTHNLAISAEERFDYAFVLRLMTEEEHS